MLAGRYRSLGSEIDCAPWLTMPVRPQDFELNLVHLQNNLEKALELEEEASYDLITLSNELDYLEKTDQIKVIAAATKLLKPGGVLLWRSMLETSSNLIMPNQLTWQKSEKSQKLENSENSEYQDRAFLNSKVFIAAKKI